MYPSLLNSVYSCCPCVRRKFRVLASTNNYLVLASREYYHCSYVSIYHTSKNCFRVMVYISASGECSLYNTYKSVKDLCVYLDTLSSML